jgi:hypothetical protein
MASIVSAYTPVLGRWSRRRTISRKSVKLLRSDLLVRRQDLDRRTEQRERTDRHAAHVEHDADNVEVHVLAELDVRAVIAVERWPDGHAVTSGAEPCSRRSASS